MPFVMSERFEQKYVGSMLTGDSAEEGSRAIISDTNLNFKGDVSGDLQRPVTLPEPETAEVRQHEDPGSLGCDI